MLVKILIKGKMRWLKLNNINRVQIRASKFYNIYKNFFMFMYKFYSNNIGYTINFRKKRIPWRK